MTNRFRHINDRQVVGLFLLMQAVLKGKSSVHLSNRCLRNLLRVQAIHDKRIRDLASSFAPFLGEYKSTRVLDSQRPRPFFFRAPRIQKNSLNVSFIPGREEMEKTLGLKIREVETETKKLTIVKKANFPT